MPPLKSLLPLIVFASVGCIRTGVHRDIGFRESNLNFPKSDCTVKEKMRNTPKLSLLGAVILLAPGALGQLGTKSVSELIAALTSRDRPHGSNPIIGIVGRGMTQEVLRQRAVARELGSRGEIAVPELDRVLGSL
jgi:hypothetical protein